MNNIQSRLTRCFSAVFPGIQESQIAVASVESVSGWDSVAAATLVATIEEEFGVELDMDALGGLTSFQSILDYLMKLQTAHS